MPFDNKRLVSLCGRFDEHLHLIEKRLDVEIHNRGNNFQISGSAKHTEITSKILKQLYQQTSKGEELTPSEVHLLIQQLNVEDKPKETKQVKKATGKKTKSDDFTALITPMGSIKPRTANQRIYVENILTHDINFGIGPAGTGKTFLAVACAVQALEQGKVRRILLVRPAVEAGERLGFLPGDLTQKIDPYLRPLYDALYEMLGVEQVLKLLEQQVIEIAPLAYMRGRTLNDSYIILDESQNTTIEQMKMFLTRIGFSSTAVITGDVTQVDLPRGARSGLKHVIDVLGKVPNISFNYLKSADVVRHPIVQQIIDAYEDYDKKQDNKKPGEK